MRILLVHIGDMLETDYMLIQYKVLVKSPFYTKLHFVLYLYLY